MNKVILMGRLTKEPEVRYSQGSEPEEGRSRNGSAKQTSGEPLAVARYTLAVNRRFKRQGEQDADFIGCVAFGRAGEFAEKYFKKGQMVSVVGRLQVRSWEDNEGKKRWTTDVAVEEQYFAEAKALLHTFWIQKAVQACVRQGGNASDRLADCVGQEKEGQRSTCILRK